MKEITEKANKLKELESLKEAKKIQKEQLAKKYDEMIENSKPQNPLKMKIFDRYIYSFFIQIVF